jgi:hypothetical protein
MSPLHHLAAHLGTFLPMAVMSVSLLMAATVASGQTRPYGDERYGSSDLAEMYAPDNAITGYPAAEVRAVAPARAAAAVARMEYYRAHNTLNNETRATQRRLERSEEMTAALNAEREAWDAYVAARDTALRDVTADSTYQTNVALRQQIARQLEDRHETTATAPPDAPARDEIIGLASLKLDYASANRVREQEVLDRSDAVRSARGRLVDARRRITQLREQHSEEIRIDPDLVAARQALYDSKVGKLAAEAYLRGVLEARDIALTYTYNRLYRYNPYRVGLYNYSYGGFPYSYGY